MMIILEFPIRVQDWIFQAFVRKPDSGIYIYNRCLPNMYATGSKLFSQILHSGKMMVKHLCQFRWICYWLRLAAYTMCQQYAKGE